MSSLFKPAENQMAYLKAGLLGFQGSGKTYTAVEIALGLYQHIGADKPVYFLDTETGSDWAIPRFKAAGVELLVARSRAFADLVAAVKDAEQNAAILLIDSVSHYWTELVESYKRKKNIKGRVEFHHWIPIKAEWQQFAELFVSSNVHIIVCGRAGWTYDYEENDDGKKDLLKTGTRMKAEGEFGYEAALLVEMERIRETDTLDGKPVGKIGGAITHRAHIVKDRRMDERSLDGRSFDNPTFEVFMPHIELLNIGGEHRAMDAGRTSDDMFEGPEFSRSEAARRRKVFLEEIEETCRVLWPSTGGKDKAAKVRVLERLFGTKSWSAIQAKSIPALERAVRVMKRFEASCRETGLPEIENALAMMDECAADVDRNDDPVKGEIDSFLAGKAAGEGSGPSTPSIDEDTEPERGETAPCPSPETPEESGDDPPEEHQEGATVADGPGSSGLFDPELISDDEVPR